MVQVALKVSVDKWTERTFGNPTEAAEYRAMRGVRNTGMEEYLVRRHGTAWAKHGFSVRCCLHGAPAAAGAAGYATCRPHSHTCEHAYMLRGMSPPQVYQALGATADSVHAGQAREHGIPTAYATGARGGEECSQLSAAPGPQPVSTASMSVLAVILAASHAVALATHTPSHTGAFEEAGCGGTQLCSWIALQLLGSSFEQGLGLPGPGAATASAGQGTRAAVHTWGTGGEELVARIGKRVLKALSWVHRCGLVHRDVKVRAELAEGALPSSPMWCARPLRLYKP